ncbi:hypothetical protein PF005_g25479 [Phytophthora fragariae]|uniref:Tc1-like transposase DDE domain-containing protein n=1 Tax=Phytophthora fragariae TaxID=53985 RepID=A0A6A3QG20_9STRA|nr:hypothetical protein PF003_g33016 [Phytophthora fragariae]KAE8923268.1 hypothetical protein PF009_g26481 [Phytophthora fragariae]KAE9075706.1 hypothetical protein PF007_g24897 [Phytophthora fragariae]KAE9088018.1 hypothetical protein PF006_g25675 [Phytophthora fragariae]KAE9175249.1 hypothetical protein PF005_g25479 [Phytophthora fragariae]
MLYDDATIKRVLRAARADQDWRDVAVKNDVNLRTAYRWVASARDTDSWESSPRKPRGGRRNAKITTEHVDYMLGLLDENCYLTLDELVDALEERFAVKVSKQTVKYHIDGRMYTIKQTHRDNNYHNLPKNKVLRRDYVIQLLAYKAEGKKIFYVDETNSNLWCSRRRGRSLKGKRAVDKNTASKGSNIHVIACISEDGLEYSEKRFGSFTSEKCNEFMRRLLAHIATSTSLDNVVIVVDNAPCHTDVEDVFDEAEFAEAKLLRLGPYSPMFNPIENCFSAFKSMVKRFLARHRQAILQVPPHRTIRDHRQEYLMLAADLLVREAITPQICYNCALHTIKFHAKAIQMKDIPVGE